jgi:hypothetical protein
MLTSSNVILKNLYKMCYFNCFKKISLKSHKFTFEQIKQLNKECSWHDRKNVQNILKLENVFFHDIVSHVVNENEIIRQYNSECLIKLDYLKELKIDNKYHPINLDLLEIYKKNIKNSNDKAIILIKYKIICCEMNLEIEKK